MRKAAIGTGVLLLALLLGSCVQMPSIKEGDSGISTSSLSPPDSPLRYPAAPRTDAADDYFGTSVADPYRALEVHDAPETTRWVEAENAFTESYLRRPEREVIRDRLRQLFDFPRVSTPERKKNRYFFSRNEGLQNQPLYYVQEGAEGKPRVVLDPNELSSDGTVAVKTFSPGDDGRLIGYSISRSGSDRVEIRVRDLESGKDLSDKLEWAKFTDIVWTPDNKGFYYNRYPKAGSVPAGDEHYFPRLMYHRLGEAQSKDKLVYERRGEREVVFGSQLSNDGQYLFVTAFKGSGDESELFVQRRGDAQFKPLFTGFKNSYEASDVLDGKLYVLTNEEAPLRRVVAVDLKSGGATGEVIPEGEDFLDHIRIINGKIVAHYLRNASSTIRIFETDGRVAGDVPLPGVGSIPETDEGLAIHGEVDGTEMFIGFTSYVTPPTNLIYDFKTNAVRVFSEGRAAFDPDDYETEQVWYPSKDGTKISMFLSHRKGLKKSPDTPVFLYGYGGFNVSMTPGFNPVHYYFMERGGIFAVANLRGGAEYGEAWHAGGMLEKKQNVFDDFTSAAEWLIRNGYTRKERLAVSGRSNGGLLAAAAVVQRPDLFEAAVVQVPVVDMLRYHRFTVARFWIPEYGSSENKEQFPFLYAYSPLHNIKEGTSYPATLITTADTDDRVDPGQAKKFAARLQEAQAGEEPILIRIDTKAGHASGSLGGAGKPVSKLIDEWADIWTFVFTQLGMST